MTDQLVDGPADGVDDDAAADDAAPETGDHDDAADASGGAGSAFHRWRERRRNRISRWDRPPEPKDWRFVVGTLGKVLIATGLLMFGFVAYQLWGTGIETARAQAQLGGEFQEQVDAISGGEEPTVGVENWVKPGGNDAASNESDEAGESGDVGLTDVGDDPLDSVPDFPPSDAVPGGVDLSGYAVDQNVPIVPGDSFARIEIPKIGVSKYVVPGVQLDDLKRGVGHYPDTPLPGQLGNASIAGHRTTYGAPFFDLDQIVPGDEIDVTMVTGDRFVYRVTAVEVVTAADYWVVTTRDPNVAELTLTTCHPKYTARDRLVVHSVLVPEASSQVGEAEFYQLDERGEPTQIAGDDPTVTTDSTDLEGATTDPTTDASGTTQTDAETDAAGTVAATEDSDATVLDSTGPDDVTGDVAGDVTGDVAGDDATGPDPTPDAEGDADAGTDEVLTPDEVDPDAEGDADAGTDEVLTPDEVDPDAAELDAFSQGWFEDRGAFPQIALWGMALAIISLLAYQVAKRTRHSSVGVLVGIAPFLVCLYFFYQNVNRLLPPGL